MRRIVQIAIVIVGTLVLLGIAAYLIWFRNPYADELQLDAESVFNESAVQDGLLIRNATLIDVERGEALPNTSVLVRGDTIAEIVIGDSLRNPGDVRVLDAGGRYLMPGLVDVHAHLSMHPHLLGGDFQPEDSLTTRVCLEQFVRYGVTTVLAFGGGGGNDEQAAELKRLEESDAIVSPLLYATGDLLTAPGSHPISTIMRMPEDVDSARLHRAGVVAVDEGHEVAPIIARKDRLGLDGIKIIVESGPPPWYPKPRLSAAKAAEIVRVAGDYGLPVYAHANSFDEMADVVNAGVRGVMHSVEDTILANTDIAERMKQNNIYYIPTLSVLYGFMTLEHPERLDDEYLLAGVSPRVVRSHEHPLLRFGLSQALGDFDLERGLRDSQRNLRYLHEQGVHVALGSDTGTPFVFAGYGVHVEMELMAEAGLSNADVLKIATINGARFLRGDDRFGTVTVGRVANMIVLARNPLDDIRNSRSIETVILKGNVISDVPSAT